MILGARTHAYIREAWGRSTNKSTYVRYTKHDISLLSKPVYTDTKIFQILWVQRLGTLTLTLQSIFIWSVPEYGIRFNILENFGHGTNRRGP